MSVATLFAATVFTGKGLERVVRLFPDGKRIVAPVHCAADVLPSADMGGRALGSDISGINMVSRYPLSTCSDCSDQVRRRSMNDAQAQTDGRHVPDRPLQPTSGRRGSRQLES